MNFYSIRELRTETKSICEDIRENGEAVITNNGKPSMLMMDISGIDYDVTLKAIRQAKAMIAMNNMRLAAAEKGYMTEAEINAEIASARRERHEKADHAGSN